VKLSVVIPTYNRRESLAVTLDGLSKQAYTPFEVIVVDDGSTDGTADWLASFATPFPLHAISQTNGGPSKARNRGVEEATGELIIFLDDDTEPAADFLAAHAALHAPDSPLAAIGPMVPDSARREPIWIAWEHAMLQKQYDAFARREWWPPGPKHFYTGNASLRRADFLAIGGFDLSYTRQEDVELAHRLQRERGVAFTFAPETAVVHRPLRTFESWARVPLAYGALDVERARRGDVGWDLVRHGYAGRNALTRLLARTEWAAPFLAPMIRQILKAAAISLHALGLRKLAIVALSALYNLLYLEGAKTALGGLRELWRTVYAPPAPSNGGAL
jgi:glycosyltransferase involved in cell wall biosynthesis